MAGTKSPRQGRETVSYRMGKESKNPRAWGGGETNPQAAGRDRSSGAGVVRREFPTVPSSLSGEG